jgi:hypothetical protein
MVWNIIVYSQLVVARISHVSNTVWSSIGNGGWQSSGYIYVCKPFPTFGDALPPTVSSTYREDCEAFGEPPKPRSQNWVLALSAISVLTLVSLSWSQRLVILSDCHHLYVLVEDLVTFLDGVCWAFLTSLPKVDLVF